MARADRAGQSRGRRALSGNDTIFARSSGAPPAAIAIIRISGPYAFAAGHAIAGTLPKPRTAMLRRLRDQEGRTLDQALVLIFPAVTSATGEDLVELHCHGGAATVRAIETALAAMPGLRTAEGGEFTRRALLNGRLDLNAAEALGDLLRAETEQERIAAIAGVEGATSRLIADWRQRLTMLAARVEFAIDYDEEDHQAADASFATILADTAALRDQMLAATERPTVERRRDGFRVLLAGPPNAGKSTLFNMLAERDAAITSPIAGTTRDLIEAPIHRAGINYLLIDTAGLTDDTADRIELVGIERARRAMATADLILWLGDDPPIDPAWLWVWSRSDIPGRSRVPGGAVAVSRGRPETGENLWTAIHGIAYEHTPHAGVVFNDRQRRHLVEALGQLSIDDDPLLLAENLRRSLLSLGAIGQYQRVDALLDALFSGFCVGK